VDYILDKDKGVQIVAHEGLFMENKDNVLFELDSYIESLSAYRDAIAADDMAGLVQLVDEGKKRKEEVDG